MNAVILAAGVGRRFEGALKGLPKCLVTVAGKTLLARHLDHLENVGAGKVIVVVGYNGHLIREEIRSCGSRLAIEVVENPDFRRGSILSLHCARSHLGEGAVIMDADVLYHADVLRRLWAAEGSCFCLDPRSDFTNEEMMLRVKDGLVRSITRGKSGEADLYGEGVGFFRLAASESGPFVEELEAWVKRDELDADYEQVINSFLAAHPARYVLVDDLPWIEIDFPADLEKAEKEIIPLLS